MANQGWVFTGASAQAIIAEAAEIARGGIPDDAVVHVHRHGNSITIQFTATGYEGDAINDSHPCPGSPGCS